MIKKLALTAALCLVGAAGVQAKTYNISLDSFCNTFTLSVAKWQVWGTRSGCGYDVIDGGVAGKIGGAKWATANDSNYTFNGDPGQFTWVFSKPVETGGTWGLYYSDGTSQVQFASGTYTITTARLGKHRPGLDASAHH